MKATLPGVSTLKIEIWDYDRFSGDDLIGETSIEIEDRYFSQQWRLLKKQPIETRVIKHPSSKMEQGFLTMWIDIIPTSDKVRLAKEIDINP